MPKVLRLLQADSNSVTYADDASSFKVRFKRTLVTKTVAGKKVNNIITEIIGSYDAPVVNGTTTSLEALSYRERGSGSTENVPTMINLMAEIHQIAEEVSTDSWFKGFLPSGAPSMIHLTP